MGYRSDVALVIHKKHEKALLSDPDIAQMVADAESKLSSNEAILFYWSWIKWYPTYDGVRCMETFLTYLPTDDYLFIRLGEDNDDTEICGRWWDNPLGLSYIRRIEYNNPSVQHDNLKSMNTRPDSTHCARCKERLNDPGMGPMYKHCPKCEP